MTTRDRKITNSPCNLTAHAYHHIKVCRAQDTHGKWMQNGLSSGSFDKVLILRFTHEPAPVSSDCNDEAFVPLPVLFFCGPSISLARAVHALQAGALLGMIDIDLLFLHHCTALLGWSV
jgi:hypothetical protein